MRETSRAVDPEAGARPPRDRATARIGRLGRIGRVTAALGIVGLAIAAGATAVPAAEAQATGPVFIDEDFMGADAAEFLAYGSACLTGAPAVPALEPGEHELAGCPEVGVVPGGLGPVPPRGADGLGYLQLTDNANDQAGAVLYNTAIPSTSGIEATFEIWQYGSTTQFNADGISFFLVDGEADLEAPGAFGGSLGYAQSNDNPVPGGGLVPGVDDGYLGIGFDTLGNFFGDWEQRGNNCPADQRSPAGTAINPGVLGDKVTVRGPGDGPDGYCFLTSTTDNLTTTGPWPGNLPGTLQGSFAGFTQPVTPESADADLVPARRTVTVEITPAPAPIVTVQVDFGTGAEQVLQFAAPAPVPESYKFGFAASTGDWNNVHLLRWVAIQALDPLPELRIEKAVALDPPVVEPTVGATVPYRFTVSNVGGVQLTGIRVVDPRIPVVTCETTTLDPGRTTTCTGEYRVTQADLDLGSIDNTAFAEGDAADGSVVTSDESSATAGFADGGACEEPADGTPGEPSCAPGLAASGSDATPPFAIGSLLVLVGGAVALAAASRARSRKKIPNSGMK